MSEKESKKSKTKISKDEIAALPLFSFSGLLAVVTEPREVSSVLEEIRACQVVGFDTETRPNFVSGQQNRVSLLQLALPEKVFLIRLNSTGLTKEIIEILSSETLLKAGVGVRDDIKALQRLGDFTPQGVVELSTLAKRAGLEAEGVRSLAGLLLGFRISKAAKTSNWAARTLDQKQISYAATDAWASLRIYQELTKILSAS